MAKMLNMKNESIKIHFIIKCLPVDFKYINPESNLTLTSTLNKN